MTDAHVTLHDVAALAGVSVSTASRALTGIKVAKGNQAKVEQAALELGYVPNEAARSLKNVRTMTLGVVFNELNGPLGTELLDALASGLEEQGYSLFVSTAQGQDDRYDRQVRRFLERRVDALMCVNASGDGAALARYAAAGIPMVALFGRSGGYDKLPLIGPAISDAADESLRRLRTQGHTHIAILRPGARSAPLETYLTLARKHGFSVRTYDVTENTLDAVRCLTALLRDEQAPTVVVARQTDAVRLFEAADEMSILIPRRLSLIGIRDRTMGMPNTRLPLSMIHLNPAKVGETAAQLILQQLSGGPPIDADVLVQMASWIERGTTGPAPTPASAA